MKILINLSYYDDQEYRVSDIPDEIFKDISNVYDILAYGDFNYNHSFVEFSKLWMDKKPTKYKKPTKKYIQEVIKKTQEYIKPKQISVSISGCAYSFYDQFVDKSKKQVKQILTELYDNYKKEYKEWSLILDKILKYEE